MHILGDLNKQKEEAMNSKKLQRLIRELEEVRKKPGLENEAKAMRLSNQIARAIPRKVLRQALLHPPEVRDRIHPQDGSRHPVLC